MQHFIEAPDRCTIEELLEAAGTYKKHPLSDRSLGNGRRIGLLFLNPSLRTRVSTQIAAANLGMESIVLNIDKDGWRLELLEGTLMDGNTVEHIKDAAAVLGDYFDILCVRSFPELKDRDEDEQERILRGLIRYSGKPVISLESCCLHPLQSLSDLLTINENSIGITKPKILLSWAPHIKPIPHCVANSFAQWMNCVADRFDFSITHPPGYELSERYTGSISINYDRKDALRDADFVYVKNWSSYDNYGTIPTVEENWLLQESELKSSAKIMHCLPVRRNVELTDDLLDGNRSLIREQAANRVWAAQAVIAELLKQQR
jgi:N-succinyl-L-ornithine transcarbamylase